MSVVGHVQIHAGAGYKVGVRQLYIESQRESICFLILLYWAH